MRLRWTALVLLFVGSPAFAQVTDLAHGGTGADNDTDARTNLSAAHSNYNDDIVSMSQLRAITSPILNVNRITVIGPSYFGAATLHGEFHSFITDNSTIVKNHAENSFSVVYGGISGTGNGHGISAVSVSIAVPPPISPATWSSYNGREMFSLTAGITISYPMNTNSDLVAFGPGVTINQPTNAGGVRGSNIYGISASNVVNTHGNVYIMHGVHVEQMLMSTGTGGSYVQGVAKYRDAFSALANGNAGDATHPLNLTYDAAYVVSCSSSAYQCYKHFLALETRPTEALLKPALDPSGDIIASDDTFALANGINLPNGAFSGNCALCLGANISITGSGLATLAEQFLTDVSTTAASTGQIGVTGHTDTTTSKCGSLTSSTKCWEVYVGSTAYWAPLFTGTANGDKQVSGAAAAQGIGSTVLDIGNGVTTTTSCGAITDSNGCLSWYYGNTAISIPYFNGTASGTVKITGATPTVAAGQVGLGKTGGAAAACNVLASITGTWTINVGGTNHSIPYC